LFSKFFIQRPIFAAVISILIVIAGLVAMRALPVAQYPNITPVQIQVTTAYPGADAKTVGDSVAAPIEFQINGVDNMLYMTSTSSNTGQLTITVFFSLDTDPDMAQVLVQNRVNLAMPQLPDVVKQFGVSVQKKSSSTLMIIAVYNPDGRYSSNYVTTYTNVYILDAIKRISGAGQAQIFGQPDQAMRIWMDPDRMASLAISTSDIQKAIAGQNTLVGAGQIGQEPSSPDVQLTFPVITQLPFEDPKEYENIILRGNQLGSAIVRVGDVARAEVGRKQYIGENFLNGAPTTAIVVYQQAGANGLDVSAAVKKTMEGLKNTMPEGMDYIIALDSTDFVKESIREVIKTLIIAVFLVILVVFFFLQNFRATVICTSAIIVALVGTFVGMYFLGFSINLLTLFGLVLAIGMVVDDAIVVVENVERNLAEGKLSSKEASIKAMEEVSAPVVAVVLVLAAVFIPAAFLPGTTGQLYQQFAITIVISVTLSGFVALTLTPALCAVMLSPHKEKKGGFFGWFNRAFERGTHQYGSLIEKVVRQKKGSFLFIFLMFVLIIYFFKIIPTSFVPNEDQGYVMTQVVMPDGASLPRTSAVSKQVDEIFSKDEAVQYTTDINGFSLIDGQYKSNAATVFVKLKPFEERYQSSATAKEANSKHVLKSFYEKAETINKAVLVPIAPPAIPGIGTTGGFEFWIQDLAGHEPTELADVTQKFLQEAEKHKELTRVHSTFRADSEQLKVDVDRAKAVLLSVPIQDVYNALQAQFGSLQVSQYEQFSRVWNVILQSDAPFRMTPDDITRLYTKSAQGSMVPLSALVSLSYRAGPDLVPHFNGFPSAQITGSQAPGYSSGEAILAMKEVAAAVLPEGYGYAWSGMAYQEIESGGSGAKAFVFGIIIVFLILAAMYESWTLPASVLMAVPFGVIGALVAIYLRNLENDVYFQIGMLVLVGLAAKNAILIVEFAVELVKCGKGLLEAAIEAGKLRLRPIIMTSLAFIFGVLPLFFAMGAGANARHSIGTGIIGGMIGASTLALVFVPLFFTIFERKK
jgi:multidrug efflux pump